MAGGLGEEVKERTINILFNPLILYVKKKKCFCALYLCSEMLEMHFFFLSVFMLATKLYFKNNFLPSLNLLGNWRKYLLIIHVKESYVKNKKGNLQQ